jgi:hypothetical protein
VTLQHNTQTKLLEKTYGKPTSLLFRWAAGTDTPEQNTKGKSAAQREAEGKATTRKTFCDAVVWYLRFKLSVAVREQGSMVDARVERERQKGLSRLSDVRNRGVRSSISLPAAANDSGGGAYANMDLRARDTYDPSLDSSSSSPNTAITDAENLSATQLSLFATENAQLFSHFNDQLSKITHAEKSLLEISSLQQTLLGSLSVQAEQIGALVGDAEQTGEDLRRGNKELKRAGERGSVARGVFWGTVGICGFLVVWDLVF